MKCIILQATMLLKVVKDQVKFAVLTQTMGNLGMTFYDMNCKCSISVV